MKLPRRLTYDQLNDSGCMLMVCAVLSEMTAEFKQAYRRFLANEKDREARDAFFSIRQEFLSDYFHNLTHLDGQYIVRKLQRLVREEIEAA